MPELPEVQTTVNQLKVFEKKHLIKVKVHDFKLNTQKALDSLKDQILLSITRRGKYMHFAFENRSLIVHLRMTGQFLIKPKKEKHDRATFFFFDQPPLFFKDTRRFGTFLITNKPEEVFQKLGKEPLDPCFTPEELYQLLLSRKQPLKAALLDQTLIAGLGNIYTDEALWKAALHPQRKSSSISFAEAKILFFAIREVLQKGLDQGGTSLGKGNANFHAINGQTGKNQNHLWVYAREKQPCPICKNPIQKIAFQQRGTHFCPLCQGI
ncbi:Formamidopyrimidine-DNA glycosylase [Candidatus Rhabdochlamydia oedothoracis]|uniref:Formamidopyrimidine-DNA glycosylase n=1 Tax=Candidatus Rhabdochlamydia oedothoracis TaxID=2720720 RepID=A0ABX8V148_9BACT|nr:MULTISPECIES: bifunctional DNA-formamidopyrimidine glycosylase/DNA-(apurinic or apyrimidinic site) lyase [Rhabdochlamydia]KAG6558812.1 Formamidopyrimidine-DNA glycosylase [Candidatus Rhabdochlamydia sp. W815]QYF48933.1 Formamidopyrimidine-DNA glycosylase [Candidatus Rhabdochlamydia oedothoracis]